MSDKEKLPFLEKIRTTFMNDIGIDLGTVNTLVHVRGVGIIYNEPTILALNKNTGKIIAIGRKAREMQGKTPQNIQIVEPLVDGVISDIGVAEDLMRNLLTVVTNKSPKLLGPRVVVGVPSEITNVERRAVRSALKNAGARGVHIVTEPIAAAIGIKLPFHKINGHMIVDIGGGTTDIMVLSTGGIVLTKNLRIAGKKLDNVIKDYVRDTYNLVIGIRSSEEIKKVSSPYANKQEINKYYVRGRNVVNGLPDEISITNDDIKNATHELVEEIIVAIKEVLESTPPEVASDLYGNGVHIVGGGAMLDGLSGMIQQRLSIPVKIPEEPLLAVVKGTGIIIENLEKYKSYIIPDDEQFNPQLKN